MPLRPSVSLGLVAGAVLSSSLAAQAAPRLPERAVRRDIPMTNAIQRAFAAGTRDSTGRPGRNYAQLRNDYTINVRLDPSTQRLTGRETIVIHNNTADSLSRPLSRPDDHARVRTLLTVCDVCSCGAVPPYFGASSAPRSWTVPSASFGTCTCA